MSAGIESCPICSNPPAATWEERLEHGCSLPGEVAKCVWCGKAHRADGMPTGSMWCNEACSGAHQAANPDAEWWKGWEPIADTLPGGRLDGVWENSGFTISPNGPAS